VITFAAWVILGVLFSLFLSSVCLCLCLCVVSALPPLLPQKQTHQKKRKKGEFCASIIGATKWLWSAAIALAVASPAVAVFVA